MERHRAGIVPKKHPLALREGERLRYEECLTRDGFDGPYTIFYHANRPHAQRAVDNPHGWKLPEAAAARPLRKRHYQSQQLAGGHRSIRRSMRARRCSTTATWCSRCCARVSPIPLISRTATATTSFTSTRAAAFWRSILGDLTFGPGDYVYVPRGVIHRFLPNDHQQYWLSIEGLGGIGLLKQWRNEVGQLRMDAPYSHRDFRAPEFRGPLDEGIRTVAV